MSPAEPSDRPTETRQPTATRSEGLPQRDVLTVEVSARTMWRLVAVVLTTLALLWGIGHATALVGMVIVSGFFTLALTPGVNHLHERFRWRRGTAVGVIYLTGAVSVLALVGFLIPAMVDFAHKIAESGAVWLSNLDSWLTDNLQVHLFSASDAAGASQSAADGIQQWADQDFGRVLAIASSGLGLIFSLATIAMFTFYLTVDFPRLQRWFLSWFAPDKQQRLGWTIDEAIRQTGGYFYSRLLLMVINGIGFFVTMVVVGVPLTLAIPLALFGSFVSVFIPAVGTYIGGAVPVVLTLAVQGLTAALIVLAYVLVYQQIENYWLSPHLSAKTMTLNGGLAFGAALLGGSLFGPMGAFMALPVTALIVSFFDNYRRSHDVVYASKFAADEPSPPA